MLVLGDHLGKERDASLGLVARDGRIDLELLKAQMSNMQVAIKAERKLWNVVRRERARGIVSHAPSIANIPCTDNIPAVERLA